MKVGLVLEGGALRTIFSTGVFDAMLEKDLMADYVIGDYIRFAGGEPLVHEVTEQILMTH